MVAIRISIIFLIGVVSAVVCQRSPYAPRPWSYPGLHPRFNSNDESSSSSTETSLATEAVPQNPTTQSTTTTVSPSEPSPVSQSENDLGTRFGDIPSQTGLHLAPGYWHSKQPTIVYRTPFYWRRPTYN